MVLGILAHVDAGKTTLSEAMLYVSGQIRTLGRVDHQDAHLDTEEQERKRGITIFSKQARMKEWTIVDTPGHVDFSAEMERTLQVLDYAILVISGTDGVQGHTRTLWRLLSHYQVPAFIFVNKMDLPGTDRKKLQEQLKSVLSDACVDFTADSFYEEAAFCGEQLLEEYMQEGKISPDSIAEAVAAREIFPCFYGSALKLEGIEEFLSGIRAYTRKPGYGSEFAARVYKIGRDQRGVRLTYLKVTGGVLHLKDRINCGGREEKVDQIRLYSGDRYDTAEEIAAGQVCVVTGLESTEPGQGLGADPGARLPLLEPVLNYQMLLPEEISPLEMMRKLKELEEENPLLQIVWKEDLQEIHLQIMGQMQMEVLTELIHERFGVWVSFGQGNIVYKETIAEPVEGIGHFEPLRHYAEVHLLLEPGERGSGIQVESACSEDVLSLNWQRLIASHVMECEHPGVLTGAALTDVKVTILTGRAHPKHTEGGDFRQATFRAIRQGLMSTKSVLLEPVYAFSLEVPQEMVGRAMADIRQRNGRENPPQYTSCDGEKMAVITGWAPVSTMQDYPAEVSAYTRGTGNLSLTLAGYEPCHNSEEVIEKTGYDSEADTANPSASVFCFHGAGMLVPWDQVDTYMHLERVYQRKPVTTDDCSIQRPAKPGAGFYQTVANMSTFELDKELADVYQREFGMSRQELEEERRREKPKPKKPTVKLDKKGNPIYPAKDSRKPMLVVDGYNIIHAWKDLKELFQLNMDSARDRLKDMLLNYQAYERCRLVVVFDAYKVRENAGKKEIYDGKGKKYQKEQDPAIGIEVVYTATDETADAYIERLVHEENKKYRISVATNDGLEQLTVMSQGALRMTAENLRELIAELH